MIKYTNKHGKRIANRYANGSFYLFDKKLNKVVRKIIWGVGITTHDGYWWSDKRQKWETYEQYVAAGKGGRCTHYNHKSRMNVRKFRRLLRNWGKYLPSGVEFILVSRYPIMDVTGETV